MDLMCSPSHADILALDIHDTVKFLRLNIEKLKTGALTKDDFALTNASMPSLPQQVDSYNVTCMTWCAYGGSTGANALALGLANGKVVLSWPDSGTNASHVDNAVLCQASKSCTSLAWSKAQPELLALGTERSRAENSLLIWDLSSSTAANERVGSSSDVQKLYQKPYAESCFAEAVNSVMWTKNEAKTLIAGVGAKSLRMYDIRSIRTPSNTVSTKATFGLCQDPCLDSRFASFFENQVHIWDLRSFSKPAAVIPAKFNILKAEWCPTRQGLLATVSNGSSDGSIVRIYDTSHTMVTDSEPDIAYRHVEQIVKLDLGNDDGAIGTFTWRHDCKNHLIAVTNTGTLHCVNVPERIALGWTKDSRLTSACKQLHQCFELQTPPQKETEYSLLAGIEQIISKRAKNGYGINDSVENYDPQINLEPDNKPLHAFWQWIKMAKESFPITPSQDIKPPIPNPTALKGAWHRNVATNSVLSSRFCGLHSELKQGTSTSQSISWVGVPNVNRLIYKSPQRSRALKMCHWTSIEKLRIDNTELRKILLESANVERSAAIALWHLDMQLAIEILRQSGAGDGTMQHPIVAMALSGYTGNGASPLWHDMCANLQESLPSPYLRSAFAFLNSTGDSKASYKAILQSNEISVLDRIGFMCTYLNDEALVEVLDDIAETAANMGNLEGVAATGLTTERGIELVQSYVDRTKDVQTAALALIQTGSNEILRNQWASHIIQGYRNLLNSWMLWKERAIMDNTIGKLTTGQQFKQHTQGISVLCNFCGRSAKHSTRMQGIRGRGVLVMRGSGMLSKPTSCPTCRKPLPRCSACCIYLGTPQSDGDEITDFQDNDGILDCWFTWCPSCKHGGHSNHLTTWFNDHTDCPVSGCVCKCWSDKLQSENH